MSYPVQGDGPLPAEIFIVGIRPGFEEIKRGRPFVGKSGLELDRYLLTCCGVDRSNVRVSNLVRDFHGDDEPTPEEIERDWPLLLQELSECSPRYLVLLGGVTAKKFLGSEFSLDWGNGLVRPTTQGYIIPIVHPAAGLHRQAEAVRVWWGFQQLGRLLRGEALPQGHLQDCEPHPRYELVDRDRVEYRCAVDTEGSRERPWCLSFSAKAGKGYVVRHGVDFGDDIILHNSLHDLSVLKALGCNVGKFTDTMVMANLLGTEPMGLKSLARRYCGMLCEEYGDIIRPAMYITAIEYLGRVVDWIAEKEKNIVGDMQKKTESR